MILLEPSTEAVLSYIIDYRKDKQSDFLILCGEGAGIDYQLLIDGLNNNSVRFCGGVFPSVICDDQNHSNAVLVLPLLFEHNPEFIFGLDDGEIEIPTLKEVDRFSSLFILADGLSNWISKFIYELYREMGSDYQVFGAGTGFSSFERKNCLFNQDGFHKDAAIVLSIKNPINQSIRHGWKTISGPYLATKTSANVLAQINWKPAFQICKNIIEEQEDIELTPENYYEYAKYYPFGIYRDNEEILIRDPVSLEPNDAIRFGAEIPSNAVLYLMKSRIDDMLAAGESACKEVMAKTKNPGFLFIADCISRTWILNEHISKELKNISEIARPKDVPVFGVFSMGEISSAHGGLLDYHHKTVVISMVENNE